MPVKPAAAQVPIPPEPQVNDEAVAEPSDFGMLDAAETTKIRQAVSSIVRFLASRRMIPAFLMRVGPLRVLLPIVWGVHSFRSKKWLAGTSFIAMGLISLVLALQPFATLDIEPDVDEAEIVLSDDELGELDASDLGSPEDAKLNAAGVTSNALKIRTGLREPIFRGDTIESTAKPAAPSAEPVQPALRKARGVWLLGTIEDSDERGTRHAVRDDAISRLQR
jgi:hypothetical protein